MHCGFEDDVHLAADREVVLPRLHCGFEVAHTIVWVS